MKELPFSCRQKGEETLLNFGWRNYVYRPFIPAINQWKQCQLKRQHQTAAFFTIVSILTTTFEPVDAQWRPARSNSSVGASAIYQQQLTNPLVNPIRTPFLSPARSTPKGKKTTVPISCKFARTSCRVYTSCRVPCG